MQYQIIYNPDAGRGKAETALPLLQYHLKRAQVDYQVNSVARVDQSPELLKQFKSDDIVVALGGDGTINRLLPRIIQSQHTLGIIPAGMINNLARAAGVSRRVPEAVQTLLAGNSKLVDVGQINDDVYFINGIGVGFDGQVNLEGNDIHSMAGQKVYVVAIAKALRKYEPVKVHVEMNDRQIDTAVFQMAIGNSPYMGGGFRLTPEALMDDGALDIAMVEPLKKGRIVRNIRKLRNGKAGVLNEVHLDRTCQLTFTSEAPLPIHYDGEVYQPGDQQISVKVIPAAVRLIGGWDH